MSTCDEGTPSLDSLNSEKLNKGTDEEDNSEAKIKATKGAEEIKTTEKRTSIELEEDNLTSTAAQRIVDVPAPTPGRIDLSQVIRSHRSSSRVASPSTSLSSLSIRGRARSRLSVSSPEDVTRSSSFPSDTKFSSTNTKVLAGAGVSCSSATFPITPASATPSAAIVTTITPLTAPIEKAASVSSQSAFRPTTNAELVAATDLPATPASIFKSTAISPTKSTTLAASESSHLESASASASAMTNKPLTLSPSTPPAATSTHAVLAISPTTPTASSRLVPLASPAAIFSELPPSQASNISQDEVLVSRMVIEKENETNEGDTGNLVERTAGKIELKMASRTFESESEEEEEEEMQQDRRLSLSLSPLSSLSPSISGSPYRVPAKASGLSTLRPRSAILFTSIPHSPLASASSKNQTQTDQVPEAPLQPPTQCAVVVSSSCSPTTTNLVNDQPEFQSPLFSSPSNSISVEQRKEEEEESVSPRLKSPEDNNDGTTDSAIATIASKVVASVSTHTPAQSPKSIEILLPRDLSPISEVEKGGETVEGTGKTQVEKEFTSIGDNADIVRVKKRKVLEGSSRTDREPLGRNPFKTPSGKVKRREGFSMVDCEPMTRKPFGLKFVKKKEIDDLEVGTKSGDPVKKRSLFNLKVGKKGDSLAVTRVRKRKTRPDSVADGDADGVRQDDDGLDEERPLKRARQRVSDNQMKTEPAEKGKQLSGRSEPIFGAETLTTDMKPRSSVSVKRGPPSKARLSVNKGRGNAEVKWPTIAEKYKDVKTQPSHSHTLADLLLFFSFSQLVECDKLVFL